jgi:hypothetical protein
MNPSRAYEAEPTTKLQDRPQTAERVADFPSLIVIIMFSVIGLLITANLVLRFPDPALTVEQLNTFAGP